MQAMSSAKAQNRFADCFIRQIGPDNLHSCFWIHYVHSVVLVIAYENLLKLFITILFCT